ncbi:MAG: hypothetical protein LUH17_04075 [Acidaminococcaceae bacterium]|nr:hypothetical protein [Acidaminococcaceae bacterium]
MDKLFGRDTANIDAGTAVHERRFFNKGYFQAFLPIAVAKVLPPLPKPMINASYFFIVETRSFAVLFLVYH